MTAAAQHHTTNTKNLADIPLPDLMRNASGFCVDFFRRHGRVTRMYHLITAAGQHVITHAPPITDKDMAAEVMRAIMRDLQVVRYVCIDEAWLLRQPSQEDLQKISIHGVRGHPDRIEVVMLTGEDPVSGQLLWWHRIHRPPDQQPYLGSLEEKRNAGIAEGRMVGLLPVKGATQ